MTESFCEKAGAVSANEEKREEERREAHKNLLAKVSVVSNVVRLVGIAHRFELLAQCWIARTKERVSSEQAADRSVGAISTHLTGRCCWRLAGGSQIGR